MSIRNLQQIFGSFFANEPESSSRNQIQGSPSPASNGVDIDNGVTQSTQSPLQNLNLGDNIGGMFQKQQLMSKLAGMTNSLTTTGSSEMAAVSNSLSLVTPVSEIGFDQVGLAGKPVALKAKFSIDIPGPIDPDLEGKNVEFFVNGKSIGITKTNEQGIATLNYTPPAQGQYQVTYRVADKGFGDAQGSATLYVNDTRPTLIFDIDGTLSNLPEVAVPFVGEKAPTFDKAPDVLRALAQNYNIIYLTARDELLTDKTKEFLARNNFPPGAVLVNDLGLETPEQRAQLNPDNHGIFKAGVIQDLQKRGITVAAGIGNAATDEQAYVWSGVPSFIFDMDGMADDDIRNSTIFSKYAQLPQLLAQLS